MTSPYYQVSDNDHFLSNIADWLATDERQWDLKDFPYLFDDPVDLIQTFSEAVDPTVDRPKHTSAGIVRPIWHPAMSCSTEADPEHDALYIGTYSELDTVQDFLTAADITITFSSTQTTTVSDRDE